jgi:hypothetical protein
MRCLVLGGAALKRLFKSQAHPPVMMRSTACVPVGKTCHLTNLPEVEGDMSGCSWVQNPALLLVRTTYSNACSCVCLPRSDLPCRLTSRLQKP